MKLDELEALAAAATPGPWTHSYVVTPIADTGDFDGADHIMSSKERVVSFYDDDEASEKNAAYIAAFSPDVGAKLLAVVRAAQDLERDVTGTAFRPNSIYHLRTALTNLGVDGGTPG